MARHRSSGWPGGPWWTSNEWLECGASSARYGALGVFIGRFLPGLRFMAGPLAGASGLRFRRFLVANVLGAGVFVPYGVGLGCAVGYGLHAYVTEIRGAERAVVFGAVLCGVGLVSMAPGPHST